MKPFFTLIAVFTLMFALGCAETGQDIQKDTQEDIQEEAPPQMQQYTAYNIWRLRSYLI
jgi:hypothetical protein